MIIFIAMLLICGLTVLIYGIFHLTRHKKGSDENSLERKHAKRLILFGILLIVLFFIAVLAFFQWVFIPRLVRAVTDLA